MPMRPFSSFRFLAMVFWLLFIPSALAQGQGNASGMGKRVALVIGNSRYPTAPLKNPVNDAKAMAQTLKDLGFEVTLRENTSQRDMAAVVRQFGSSITPGSTALFYFAGHGMQVRGKNFLVPVDADIQLEEEVPYSTIDVSLILDKMEVGKSAVNIVILDACRNNPFSRRFRSSATGLAQMDAPIGTLIAFATAPGSVAQDGTGENGVYTRHLLQNLPMPGLAVEQMFKRVRIGVAKDTHDTQVPWESSSMKGDFVFKEARVAASQDKMIEEAVKAAAEKAATLTAERMRREQEQSRQQSERTKSEQEALATEREALRRERDRLTAENESLRIKSGGTPAPVALAAPSPTRPSTAARPSPGGLRPEVGDRWTYRYSDGYGNVETYSVRVSDVTPDGIRDEAILGKLRHTGNHEPGLDLSIRTLGKIVLREFAPYLQELGPAEPNAEWKSIQIPGGSGPFVARWAGKETVKVPAGTFEAAQLIVEGDQFFRGMSTRRLTFRIWYVPTAKRFVKISIDAPPGWALGAEKDVIELIQTSFPLKAIEEKGVTVASLSPSVAPLYSGPPRVGDTWQYRYSDVYGKSETYTVKVLASSQSEITDEIRIGKNRHSNSFAQGLAIAHRKLGSLSLRELSPYLLSFGLEESAEWKKVEVFEGKEPFVAKQAGTESIQVPAGKFEAQKIVIEGREYSPRIAGLSRTYTITAWYAPAARRVVRMTYVGATQNLFPAEQEVIELTEYRLQ